MSRPCLYVSFKLANLVIQLKSVCLAPLDEQKFISPRYVWPKTKRM